MGPFSMQSQDIPKWFSQQGSHNFYIATRGLRKPRQKLSSLLKACLKRAVSLRLYSIIKVVTDPMYWKREATSQQEECQRICRYLYSAIIHLLATRYSHSSCRRAHHTQASQESQLCSSKNTEAPPWGISSGPKDQWIKGTSQQPPTNCTMVRQRQITTIHTHLKKKKRKQETWLSLVHSCSKPKQAQVAHSLIRTHFCSWTSFHLLACLPGSSFYPLRHPHEYEKVQVCN